MIGNSIANVPALRGIVVTWYFFHLEAILNYFQHHKVHHHEVTPNLQPDVRTWVFVHLCMFCSYGALSEECAEP